MHEYLAYELFKQYLDTRIVEEPIHSTYNIANTINRFKDKYKNNFKFH